MARKSRKAKELEREILSSVPVEQRKMITQPITFTYLNGEMSMTQTRIQTMIMERLQDRIAKVMKRRAESGYFGELFSDDDFKPLPGGKTTFLTFDVKYSELGVLPANYKDVDEAARAMQRIVYEKEVIDENGQRGKEYTVVFDKVTIPEKVKSDTSVRRDTIKLRMLPETARDVFNFNSEGYHRYLKDAIFQFSSNYAGRIYLFINANKDLGIWKVSYEKLRKILLTTYDEATKKVLASGERMMAALRQDRYSPLADWQQALLILSVAGGFADAVEPGDMGDYAQSLFTHFTANESSLVETLSTGKKLDAAAREALHAALRRFAEAYRHG